jgi:hypothetical protein
MRLASAAASTDFEFFSKLLKAMDGKRQEKSSTWVRLPRKSCWRTNRSSPGGGVSHGELVS